MINNICRRLFVFCIFIFASGGISTASDKLKLENVKNYITNVGSLDNDIRTFINPPFAYYTSKTDWNPLVRKLNIHSINLLTEVKDSFSIEIPSQIVVNDLPDITINSDFLILTDYEEFDYHLFRKINKNYKFLNKIKLPKDFSTDLINVLPQNQFLFHSIYNQHPNDAKFNTTIGIYDAALNKFTAVIHPELPCIGYTHLDGSWVTNNDKQIAVANPCGYVITFYDFQLNKIDSIKMTDDKDWIDLPRNIIPYETNPAKIHAKLLIDKLLLLQDSVSRIEKLHFINDSTLLVSSMGKGLKDRKRRIDLWNMKNLSKPILTDASKEIKYSEGDNIDLQSMPLFINRTFNFTIKNNIVYTADEEDFFPKTNTTVNQFNNQKDIHYEKFDPNYSFSTYKIMFP